MKGSQRFGKSEKLKSGDLIKQLFEQGKELKSFPLKIKYLPLEGATSQVSVSVPKRAFKKAVDRNQIKRRIREAHRLNKFLLADSSQSFAIMYLYLAQEKLPYQRIEKGVKHILNELIKT